ncbi:hypothetical protein, partial [Streptomyces brasiliscabiei]|uniref:hypothetical protein n=1 Tax=Streptomyces brasiliscabiei TaxID=2736302 RepID=UPI001C10BB07
FTGGEVTQYFWPERNGAANVTEAGELAGDSKPAEVGQGKPLLSFRVPFTNLNLALRAKVAEPEPVKSQPLVAPPERVERAEPEKITTYYRAGDWGSHHGDAVGTGLVIEQTFDGEAST